MANIKISNITTYTGNPQDVRWFIMNNSGNTETFKFSGYTAGLIPGTGTDSIKSNLTSTPATASGTDSIAIGKNARATNTNSIMIGTSVNNGNGAVGIGHNINGIDTFSVGIGRDLYFVGSENVAIGRDAAVGNKSVVIGNASRANGNDCITIGADNSWNPSTRNTIIGKNTTHQDISGTDNISIGSNHSMANVSGSRNTILGGYGNTITGGTSDVVVLGLTGFTPTNNNTTYVDNIHTLRTETFSVIDAGSVGGNIDVDLSLGTLFKFSMTANTTPNFINWKEGQRITFVVDNTSTFTVPTMTITGGGSVLAKGGGVNPTNNGITKYTGVIISGDLYLNEELDFQAV